ncbi:hypothetical protein [Salinibacterium sp. TMP30]
MSRTGIWSGTRCLLIAINETGNVLASVAERPARSMRARFCHLTTTTG